MVWLPGGEKKLKICLFILTESTNVTDGRTLHDGIGRACRSSRGQQEAQLLQEGRAMPRVVEYFG